MSLPAYKKARRERFIRITEPKFKQKPRRQAELIRQGVINPAQLRAMSAICNELI